MSELTLCNYCSFAGIQLSAKKAGMRITRRSSVHHTWYKGVDIFIHPAGIRIPKDRDDDIFKLYHKAWFAELGDHCVC